MKTKSHFLLVISIYAFIVGACESQKPSPLQNESVLVCGKSDPIKDLKWLADEMKKQNFELYSDKLNGIVLFNYKGNQVIELQCSLCSSTNNHQYFCDGTKLDLSKPNDFQDYLNSRSKVKVLYGTEIWK